MGGTGATEKGGAGQQLAESKAGRGGDSNAWAGGRGAGVAAGSGVWSPNTDTNLIHSQRASP